LFFHYELFLLLFFRYELFFRCCSFVASCFKKGLYKDTGVLSLRVVLVVLSLRVVRYELFLLLLFFRCCFFVVLSLRVLVVLSFCFVIRLSYFVSPFPRVIY